MSANFTITADVIPVSGFTFKYQVSQEGDFLAASVNTTNPQTASPTFTGSRASYTAPLNLMTVEDSEGESTGVVKVELLAADGDTSTYTLGSDFEAEVKVFDNDLPELSIAGVAGTVVEGSGDKVQFTVTSSYDIGTINVRYQVIDTGSNFLIGDVEGSRQETTLNFNNTKTATLEFNIEDDDVVEEDGVVRVQLIPDFHISAVPENAIFPGLVIPGIAENPIEYTVIDDEAMQVAEVMVQDDDNLGAIVPTITLVSEYLPSDSTTATYYIVADSAPAKDLEVILEYNYETPNPDPVAGGTIDFYRNWLRAGIVIPTGQTRGTFTQSRSFTSTYSTNSPPGYIQLTRTLKVRLVDGDHYNLGNPSSSGLPTNEASSTNPLVTISVVGDNRVVESSELVFELAASPVPATEVAVSVFVSQTGDFISETLNSERRLEKIIIIPSTGTNRGRAQFTVRLDDDTDREAANGVITATIQSGTGYVVDRFNNSALATIYDDDNLPAVTIANSGPVAEDAGPVTFTLTAGVTQNIDLDVAYSVQNEVGEYLGTQLPVAGPLQFRERSGAYVADISVQLDDDQVDEADGSVSVTLITDTTYPFTYKVGAANKGIATITDNDVPSASTPKITLSSPNYIKEGASFNLVAKASHPPISLTTVNVVLSSDEDNNFLVLGSRGEKTIQIQPNQSSGMISITSQADGTTGNQGLITADLASGSGYFTSGVASENMTSVVILESLPVVSISVDNSQVKENVNSFELKLATESFTPDANRPVKISGLTAMDSGTPADYLGAIDLNSVEIDSTGQGSITVPVTYNNVYRGWGEITFTLVDGEEYTANTDSSKRIVRVTIEEVEESSRKISVSAPDRVVEGDDFEITLETTESLASGESIAVELMVVANPIGFYDADNSDQSPISMTNVRDEEKFTISTHDSTTLNTNGSIDISVVRGDQYEPASTTAETITIVAKETLPTVSFVPPDPSSIDEGEDAVFMVTATGVTLTQELEVAVSVEQGATDNFIDTAVATPSEVMIETSGTGKLRVKTKADTNDEPNGTITAIIEKSSGATYLLGSRITESITVQDNDDDGTLPMITISGTTPIYEGDDATFTLQANPAPTGDDTITARVKITETGNFLTTSAKTTPRVQNVVVSIILEVN